MDALRSFFATWGPWIATALIPTIITGLSVLPSTQPAAGVVQKVWDVIKTILSYLSIATFKDQEGTFQLPIIGGMKAREQVKMMRAALEASKLPPETGGHLPPTGGVAALILLVGFSLLHSGCCAWSHTCKADDTPGQVATDVIDCAQAEIKDRVAHLLPVVVAILTGGSPNWQEQLDNLKAGGIGILACALASASQDLQKYIDTNSAGPAGSQDNMKLAAVKAKADEYTKVNKFKTANVGQ